MVSSEIDFSKAPRLRHDLDLAIGQALLGGDAAQLEPLPSPGLDVHVVALVLVLENFGGDAVFGDSLGQLVVGGVDDPEDGPVLLPAVAQHLHGRTVPDNQRHQLSGLQHDEILNHHGDIQDRVVVVQGVAADLLEVLPQVLKN